MCIFDCWGRWDIHRSANDKKPRARLLYFKGAVFLPIFPSSSTTMGQGRPPLLPPRTRNIARPLEAGARAKEGKAQGGSYPQNLQAHGCRQTERASLIALRVRPNTHPRMLHPHTHTYTDEDAIFKTFNTERLELGTPSRGSVNFFFSTPTACSKFASLRVCSPGAAYALCILIVHDPQHDRVGAQQKRSGGEM